MYSESEFKYELKRKAQNNDDGPDRTNLDSDIDHNFDYWNYGSDYSFDWFDIWGLSFFDAKKTKHYRHLNESVFRPLNKLALKQVSTSQELATEFFNYTVNMPMESSKIFQLGLKHMKEDQPELPTEITDLRNMLDIHQQLIKKVEAIIKNVIKENLSQTYASPLKIGSRYDYNFNNLYLALKTAWASFGFNLEEIEARIEKGSTNPRIMNDHFYFDKYDIGQVNQKDFELMKNSIHDILKNTKILKGFSDLEESKENMDKKIEEINKMTNEIIESIDNDLYETKIRGCCPTFLRIFR